MSNRAAQLLAALERDGLLDRTSGRYQTTKALQSVVARAASRPDFEGESGADPRAPLACALVEIYGEHMSNDEIRARAEALWPIEEGALDPRIEVRLDDDLGDVLGD